MVEERPLILVIDDEPSMREMLEATLQSEGYRVLCMPTGEHGLARLAEGGIGLILLDWSLPQMGGAEILRHLTAGPAPAPVVILSAMGREILPEPPPGAVAVLRKPFDLDELLDLVAVYCPLSGN